LHNRRFLSLYGILFDSLEQSPNASFRETGLVGLNEQN